MAEQVNVQYAKTNLSALLTRVEKGESITIARDGRPIARLVALAEAEHRELGFARDIPDLPESFYFEPLPDDELDAWER